MSGYRLLVPRSNLLYAVVGGSVYVCCPPGGRFEDVDEQDAGREQGAVPVRHEQRAVVILLVAHLHKRPHNAHGGMVTRCGLTGKDRA